MITVTHITPNDFTQIQYLSKVGNTLSFELTFSFDTDKKCNVTARIVDKNGDFPTETPELIIEIAEDANGSTSTQITENIDVTMDEITDPVSILAKVKEGGNEKAEVEYVESNTGSINR
jgi:hypothetical protein